MGPGNTCYILNPASRRGKSRPFQAALREYLARAQPEAEVFVTEGPGHAVRLAKAAGEGGCRRLFSVGGDGTLNEVVNGLMALPREQRPAVGLLSTGTGGDFFRYLKELHPYPQGFSWLLQPAVRPCDVGKASIGRVGAETCRYFMNIADAGISGEVVRRVGTSRRLLGALEYLRATIQAAARFKPPRVQARLWLRDGETWEAPMDLLLAVAANSRYFGGGMCIAPDAKLDDGEFFFLVAEKVSYLTLVRQLPRIYSKRPILHPKVRYFSGTKMELEAASGSIPIGLDGEFLEGPRVAFEILPQSLDILVPSPQP